MRQPLATAAALGLALATPASAAPVLYNYSGEVGYAGDLFTGNNVETPFPAFAGPGTLSAVYGSVSGSFTWSEPIQVNQPDPVGHIQPSIFPVQVQVWLTGPGNAAIGGEPLDSTWVVSESQTFFSETVAFNFPFSESPQQYLSDPEFGLLPQAEVTLDGCTGPCQATFLDDPIGTAWGDLSLTLVDPPHHVPEPASWAMLASALVSLLLIKKRKRR